MKKFKLMLLLLAVSLSSVFAADTNWTFNPRDFMYDMTAYIQIEVDDEAISDMTDITVAAFIGDECRGIAKVRQAGGHDYGYIRIYSNRSSGDSISFKMQDGAVGTTLVSTHKLSFVSQSVVGYPSSPHTVSFITGDDTYRIKTFPYREDFETGVLAKGWQVLEGNNSNIAKSYWSVGKAKNIEMSTSAVFYSDIITTASSFTTATQQLKLPVFDFRKHNKATLDFDYRNFLQDLKVIYRTSPDAPWLVLKTLSRQMESDHSSLENGKVAERHVSLELPNLSANYEIAFEAKCIVTNPGMLFFLQWNLGTIDNIVVDVDDTKPVTEPVVIYTEDFESGVLGSDWILEIDDMGVAWGVTNAMNMEQQVRALYVDPIYNEYGNHYSRVIMPALNMDGCQNALLEFDYRNFYDSSRVLYRTSATEEWKLLKVLDNHCMKGECDSYNHEMDSEEHISLALPEIGVGSCYEIAFQLNYCRKCLSSHHILSIDNIKITGNYDAHVNTNHATRVGISTADINFTCFEGTMGITSRGIEWSLDQSSWTSVPANKNNQIVTLTSLPPSTTVYYRSFIVTPSGKSFGDTLSFKTSDQWFSGAGTEADPYTISSVTDWEHFVEAINNGDDMAGVYFALTNSLTLNAGKSVKLFNGCLDGRGHTMYLINDKIPHSLIRNLGKEGVVKDIKISGAITNNKDMVSPLISTNYGSISGCKLQFDDLILSDTYYGGVCGVNLGSIRDCSSKFNLKEDNISNTPGWHFNILGGTCVDNFGKIDHCSFDGDIVECTDGSPVGGIVSSNLVTTDQAGEITNCINYAKLRTPTNCLKYTMLKWGGIAGENYSSILYCVNEGSITAGDKCTTWSLAGGLVGRGITGSIISNSINRGDIELHNVAENFYAGGLMGICETASIVNCVNTGQLHSTNPLSIFQHPFIGNKFTNTIIENCYSQSNSTDPYSTEVVSWNATTRSLNEVAGFECWKLRNGKPYLWWEPNYIPGDVNDDGIVNIVDIVLLVSHLNGFLPSAFNHQAADVNNDGKIDISDIEIIADMSLR